MPSLRSVVLVILCFTLLGGGGLWLLFGSHPVLSERENRVLSPLPTFTQRTFFKGQYQLALADYARDRIPFRTSLISLCGIFELAQGRADYNGVLVGKDGFLIPRPVPKEETVSENLSAYLSLLGLCRAGDVPCSLVLAPRSADLLRDQLPLFYDGAADRWLWETLGGSVPESALLFRAFLAAEEPSSLHYRTDHHWNTDGAYLAYRTLGALLGYTPLSKEFFDRTPVTNGFLGTSDSKVCLPFTEPDEVVLYRYMGDTLAEVENPENDRSVRGFYDLSALDQKDCYKVFLGGNTARLSVTLPTGEPKPRLLLIKDSYANSVVPFLALHYDLEVIDPRYFPSPLSSLLEKDSYDRVLVLAGADTFSEQKGFLT